MPSDLASRSVRRLASAPGARHVVHRLMEANDEVRLAIGRLETHLLDVRPMPPARLKDVEFRVFSQFGEDGIIQYILREAEVASTSFVEIGVGNYRESNTRFLLENDNWRGLALDGDDDHITFVLGSRLAWRHDVEPVSAFVTAENVNSLVTRHGFEGEIGLLSIDVDGIDYWLWQALTAVEPAVVVVEYNALLGPDATVTVPYDPSFVNSTAHYSQLYFGASLGALVHLARGRGYRFVGCSSSGANAFFVRDDIAGALPDQTTRSGYRESRFLTTRRADGTLSRVRDTDERLALIGHLPVVDVPTGQRLTVAEAVSSNADPPETP